MVGEVSVAGEGYPEALLVGKMGKHQPRRIKLYSLIIVIELIIAGMNNSLSIIGTSLTKYDLDIPQMRTTYGQKSFPFHEAVTWAKLVLIMN